MRKAAAILLLIPFAFVGTLVGGLIFGLLYVIAGPGPLTTNPGGVVAAGLFVGMTGAIPASVYSVPASLLAFPLAFYLLPPRGGSTLSWTLHGAGLGTGLGGLVAAVFVALSFRGSGPHLFLLFPLATGAITGALFGFAKHKLTSG